MRRNGTRFVAAALAALAVGCSGGSGSAPQSEASVGGLLLENGADVDDAVEPVACAEGELVMDVVIDVDLTTVPEAATPEAALDDGLDLALQLPPGLLRKAARGGNVERFSALVNGQRRASAAVVAVGRGWALTRFRACEGYVAEHGRGRGQGRG